MCATKWKLTGSALIGLVLVTGGCANNTETGALVGGAAGAGVGAIIGHNSHNRTGSGALIGGAVGAIGGAIVGNQIDKDQQRQAEANATYQGNVAPPPPPAYEVSRVSNDDVISWTQRGVRDSEIIDRIDRSGTIFHLNAADEMRLRDAGVSEQVILEMRDTARR
jgi:uncharacterized protein YcfJ